ncbi:MAG: hypothetical protein Q9201_004418 [Fulgogasparrea decipioides]
MNLLRVHRRPSLAYGRGTLSDRSCELSTWRPVQRLKDSTLETFREAAFHRSLPAQLPPKTFKNFPASTKWFREAEPAFNSSYLGQFGDPMVPMELTRPESHNYKGAQFERADAPFSIFLAWAAQADANSLQRLYVAQAPVDALPKPLRDDLPTPELVAKAGKGDIYNANIWLGIAPTCTSK